MGGDGCIVVVSCLIIFCWFPTKQHAIVAVSSDEPTTSTTLFLHGDVDASVGGEDLVFSSPTRDGDSLINVQSNGDPDGSKTMLLDNRLMRDMYRTSTDKVYTVADINNMIHTIASKPNVKFTEAVTAIVNLKLIKRLQFRVFDLFYNSCSEMDVPSDKGVANQTVTDENSASNDFLQNGASIQDPSCITKFEELANPQNNCSQESCRFYLHCVLHRRQCSESMLELASSYVLGMDGKGRSRLPFATGDKQTDHFTAKAIAKSQFDVPEEAIKYATEAIEEDGESIGLLHARILASARSGINEKVVESLVKDVNLALSLDTTNEISIYRKAAVLLALAQYFEALETLELGITLYPDNAELYDMKGSCHFQLQELAQAEKCYRHALELHIENKRGCMQKLGLVLYRQGKLASAISVYKELIQLNPTDSNILISIAHCYKQQGDGKKALQYVNKAVQFDDKGKMQLMFRGSLHHSMGADYLALLDLKQCKQHHPSHELCMYHSGLAHASLGQFFEAVKSLVGVTCTMNPTSPTLQPNSQYIKASYLINYYRYLHSKLDFPLKELDIDRDLRPAFKDGWAKGTPLDMSEYFASEQRTLSPDILAVERRSLDSYDDESRRLLCRAQHYGRLMQVSADSFLPNDRFNLAMGLAAIHVGQRLRKMWTSGRKSGSNKMTWRQLYEISLPYRRLADVEIPVLWLSMIYKEEHIGYHNEVSFYRSQVKNLRMKSYFDLVFGLTRSMIKQQVSRQYPQHSSRRVEVEVADTPEDLISIAKAHIPTRISTTVPSISNPDRPIDGGMIVLTHTGYGGASLYMNIPTTHKKTQDYDQELSLLYNKVVLQASKLRTNSLDVDATVNAMMTLSYYFFNLCPFSRGSASVGLSTLVGMFLSIDQEMTKSFPPGKMLDMEATLSGAADEFIFGTKDWFKLSSMDSPVTSLPLVTEAFPTVRSLMEALTSAKSIFCDKL